MDQPAQEKKPRRRVSAKKRALFALFTLTVLLGGTEAFFQVREVVRARRKPRLPTMPHDYLGIALVPGASYDRPAQNRKMSINAYGMRGPEVGEKQPGKLRILCVGGSTTFGLYASSNESTWPARLEQLASSRGATLEVINAGAPGWTSRASMTNLELRGFSLKPDVLVCYHAYNDLMSNLEDAYVAESKVDDIQELYHPRVTSVFEHSALYRFLRSRLRSPYDAFKQKADTLREVGIESFARNLQRLVRRAREIGAKPVLCTFPTCFRPTLEESRRDQLPELEEWYGSLCPITYPHLIEGLRRYNETVRAVAKELQVPLVELEAVFPRDVALYHSPLHHSDAGERKVAELVLAKLEAEKLVTLGAAPPK
ncbi:MAG: SGNH/GDSL hydrolase family protein [Planctomycetota bacterium]